MESQIIAANTKRRSTTPSQAKLQRVIKAARAEDPTAVVEFEIEGVLYRVKRHEDQPPATPFDAWKAKRDAHKTQGN